MMNNMGGEDDLPDVDGADDVRIIQAIILRPEEKILVILISSLGILLFN